MSEIREIDIEKIINEIREDIKKKGYKGSDLSFCDITINEQTENIVQNEEQDELKKTLYYLNTNWCHDINMPVNSANQLARFMKKLIRKFIRFSFYPVLTLQNNINANIVNSLNVLTDRMETYKSQENAKIEELMKKVEALESELAAIKMKDKGVQ